MTVSYDISKMTLNEFLHLSKMDEGSDEFMEAILQFVDHWGYDFEKDLEVIDEQDLAVYGQLVKGFLAMVQEVEPNPKTVNSIEIDVSAWKVKDYRKITRLTKTAQFDDLIPMIEKALVVPANVVLRDAPYVFFVSLMSKVTKTVSDRMNQGK